MSRLVDYKVAYEAQYERRGNKCLLLGGLLLALLVSRLLYLQVLRFEEYQRLSGRNHIRLVPEAAARGSIYDRHGELLVRNIPGYQLCVVPGETGSLEQLLERLAALAGVDAAAARLELAKVGRRLYQPVPLLSGLSTEVIGKLEERKGELPGVMIRKQPRRHYVNGRFLAHVLGYTGPVSKEELARAEWRGKARPYEKVGKCGVEKSYDAELRGRTGGTQVEVDSRGRHLRTVAEKKPSLGDDLYLTIDLSLQRSCEEILEGFHGAIMALDPRNGEILAMVSKPDFDPNEFAARITRERWQELTADEGYPLQNKNIQGEYPPGSIYKLVTAVAALETRVISPYQSYLCQGVVNFRDWPYRCWKEHGHGWTDMNRALIESCDIYFYRAGIKAKVDALNRYSLMLGLGEESGVDLPGEKAGLVPSAPWKRKRYGRAWYYGNTIQMSIGQGFLLATPIQMACLMAAFGESGTLYRPHLLKELRSPDGEMVRAYKPEVNSSLLVSKRTMKILRRALWGVVNVRRGTGVRGRLRTVSVAGKTSTAENPQGEPHGVFACYAPSDEPRLVMMVMLENGGEGGRTAAPMAKYLLEVYFGLKHDLEMEEIKQIVRKEMDRG